MATNKSNIFNSLPQHGSDSEGEDTQQNTRVKRTNEKRDPKTDKTKGKTTGDNAAKKEEHSRHKDARPQKGVTSEPHPLDRHSGTGQPAYGGKPKKGGSGKGNWGSDRRPNEEPKEDEEGNDNGQEKVQEEEKPELTLQEYYQKRGATQQEAQINEAKAKITAEQLLKEMGTATMLKTKSQQKVDDHKVGKKKDHLDVDHHAAITTEHATLLNFRTGFVEKEYKPRGQDETGPRKYGQRTEGGKTKKTEEVKEETQPATEAGEAQPATEGQAATTEGQTATAEGQDNQNRRRPEGQRGGNRGGYRGDRAQGDRPQGDRKPYGGKSQQVKVDFADESAFPKLG